MQYFLCFFFEVTVSGSNGEAVACHAVLSLADKHAKHNLADINSAVWPWFSTKFARRYTELINDLLPTIFVVALREVVLSTFSLRTFFFFGASRYLQHKFAED